MNIKYKLNIDQYIRDKDPNPEVGDSPEIDDLCKDVIYHLKHEKKLREEIPEFAVVSMFQIDWRDFRDNLSGKHK